MISSPEEFVTLRTSEDPELYHRAAHDSAPEEVWLEVIAKYPDMKEWVVLNKTVPLRILEILADDPDDRVRWWVAQKRKLSFELFTRLARDPDYLVRECIVLNRRTPLSILQLLTADPDPDIAYEAQQRINLGK